MEISANATYILLFWHCILTDFSIFPALLAQLMSLLLKAGLLSGPNATVLNGLLVFEFCTVLIRAKYSYLFKQRSGKQYNIMFGKSLKITSNGCIKFDPLPKFGPNSNNP